MLALLRPLNITKKAKALRNNESCPDREISRSLIQSCFLYNRHEIFSQPFVNCAGTELLHDVGETIHCFRP